ncbi:MAG: hypothetical protein ACK4VI_02310 [Alphaproteobacteria bacterium]
MILNVLGFKRLAIISFLVAVNIVSAASIYLYLEPEIERLTRAERSERSKENELKNNIDALLKEFDAFDGQKNLYEQLSRRGFFSNQNRQDARGVFQEAKEISGVSDAVVNVRPGVVSENQIAAKAGQVLLESQIVLQIKAVDDVDIYAYLAYLDRYFPGHLTIQGMFLRRNSNISDTILRAIAGGANPDLVHADINLIWRTMVSREAYLSSPEASSQGRGDR